jgi:hypothetical protein
MAPGQNHTLTGQQFQAVDVTDNFITGIGLIVQVSQLVRVPDKRLESRGAGQARALAAQVALGRLIETNGKRPDWI